MPPDFDKRFSSVTVVNCCAPHLGAHCTGASFENRITQPCIQHSFFECPAGKIHSRGAASASLKLLQFHFGRVFRRGRFVSHFYHPSPATSEWNAHKVSAYPWLPCSCTNTAPLVRLTSFASGPFIRCFLRDRWETFPGLLTDNNTLQTVLPTADTIIVPNGFPNTDTCFWSRNRVTQSKTSNARCISYRSLRVKSYT